MRKIEPVEKKILDPKHSRVETELLKGDNNSAIDSWRIFKIMSELVDGFELIRNTGKAVTFFGTARCNLDDEQYKEASELAGKLAKSGFTVITGGGSGVMEAANKGASEAGGRSIGLNIELPSDQKKNEHATEGKKFHYFFTRKIMLSFASEAYVFFPGGFGTMDEFFEIVTLVQTKKINKIPIIIYGKEYWEPLTGWIKSNLYEKYHTINKEDTDIYHLVDSVEEAHETIINLVDEYCKPGVCD